MKRLLFLLLLLLCAGTSNAQCVDESRFPNDYYACPGFNPVCGCDNVTYRNYCAAYNWAALSTWTDNTVCGGFFFDFYPTAVSFFPGTFNLYMKSPGSATMYIFDNFGILRDQRNFIATYNGQVFTEELQVNTLDYGLYIMIVQAAGEKQTMKFSKVVQTGQ
ncbi:MAG: hypothetical protein ACKO7B_00700 [Flavobacteriales bacterium]